MKCILKMLRLKFYLQKKEMDNEWTDNFQDVKWFLNIYDTPKSNR